MNQLRYTHEEAQELIAASRMDMREMHKTWEMYENLYASGSTEEYARRMGMSTTEAHASVGLLTGVGSPVANFLLPILNLIIDQAVANDPNFECESIDGTPDGDKAALLNQAILKYFWKRVRATDSSKDSTKDMVVTGNGFLHVGWNFEEEEQERDSADVELDMAEAIDSRLQVALENDLDYVPGSVKDVADAVELTEYRTMVNEPFVQWVSPYDLLVEPQARRLNDARWVAKRVRLPLDEAQLRWPRAQFRADSLNDRPERERLLAHQRAASALEWVTLYEFYDLRGHALIITQEGAKEPLEETEMPYDHVRSPFVHFRGYSKSGKDFWCFGETANLAGLHTMHSFFWNEQMQNARRGGLKILADEDVVTDEVEGALNNDTPDLVIKVKRPTDGTPLSDVLVPVFRPSLSSDVYGAQKDIKEAMNEVAALNEFQTGGSGADRMSATAAAVVDSVASKRAESKVLAVERAIAEAGELILLLCQQFLDTDTAVKITGPRGSGWVKVDPELIQGEYRVSIEGGSTKPINKTTRQKRAQDKLQLLPVWAEQGYKVDRLMRDIAMDYGLDPDLYLERVEQAPPPAPEGGAVPPEMAGLGLPPEMAGMPPAMAPEALGGPPDAGMAQVEGDLAL